MNQQELLERIKECTLTQLREIKALCTGLIKEYQRSQGIHGDIMQILRQSPEYRIPLSDLKRRLRNNYSAQAVHEAVDVMETINGGYLVLFEPIPEQPRRRHGMQPVSTDKMVIGRWLKDEAENS